MSSMAMARAEVFRPKAEDKLGLGMVLALAAHLLLVLALAFGVSWRTNTPVIAEAEVWAEVPKAVAPAEEPPPPTPVEETPPPPPPVAQAEPEPVPEPEADIPSAPVPKAKRKKEKPLPPVAKVEPPPKPKKKPAPPKETFITEPPVVAKKPKTPSVPPTTPTVSSAERETQRKAAMQRMMKDLGSLGTSEQSAGPSANYVGKLRARIIPNITFLMDEGSGNPTAFVEIRCAPDGTILSRRLLDPSGSPAWDKAVLDGIDKTRSLPLDERGRLPDTVFQIGISPRDR
ncbi:cell envelope integrity protein TolA [Aquabacterium sp.]|uniref:cell envelope integrity protein TolA n=1 Tax=Aquabacterium sp. TaxID=1872578 RepID=UPI002489137B|nr:cell envelope integrity protein TolA [Aquabacterium sp.]MDI1259633.1 cell envelope integrity protein TolA [Aquabacterium sp.]